jgi:argininosuccinate lyase
VAHRIASRVVTERAGRPGASIGGIVADESAAQAGRAVELDEATLARILSPEHFIAVRRTPGGPAPEQTSQALGASRAQLAADEATAARRRGALAAAEIALRSAAHAIGA